MRDDLGVNDDKNRLFEQFSGTYEGVDDDDDDDEYIDEFLQNESIGYTTLHSDDDHSFAAAFRNSPNLLPPICDANTDFNAISNSQHGQYINILPYSVRFVEAVRESATYLMNTHELTNFDLAHVILESFPELSFHPELFEPLLSFVQHARQYGDATTMACVFDSQIHLEKHRTKNRPHGLKYKKSLKGSDVKLLKGEDVRKCVFCLLCFESEKKQVSAVFVVCCLSHL
jgi:hypothetical protein